MMMHKSYGSFSMSEEVYKSPSIFEYFQLLNFVPCHAEFHWHKREWTFEGFSPQFRGISEGGMAPHYSITLLDDGNHKKLDLQEVSS